jgi:hypothetical protein
MDDLFISCLPPSDDWTHWPVVHTAPLLAGTALGELLVRQRDRGNLTGHRRPSPQATSHGLTTHGCASPLNELARSRSALF